jgi:UDP-N-acetylmuramyl pentapeptide synthase
MVSSITSLGRRTALLAHRTKYLFEWHISRRLSIEYARIHRRRLNDVTFVGVTGSVGKASAETLTTAILESSGRVTHTVRGGNRLHHMAKTVVATRPTDKFCVLEMGAERPGFFDPMLKLVRPRIGIVTAMILSRY